MALFCVLLYSVEFWDVRWYISRAWQFNMANSTVIVDMVSKATFLVAIRLHLKVDVQRYTFQSEIFLCRIVSDAYLKPRNSSFSNGDVMGFTIEKTYRKVVMVCQCPGCTKRENNSLCYRNSVKHDRKINE